MTMIPSVIKPGTESFVIDSEVVAFDTETKKILPFQVLSTRKRKDVNEGTITVQVCLFAFDILFLNGQSLLKEPLATRRDKLRSAFQVKEGEFQFATSRDASDTEEILAFLNDSIKDSCEGLMVKTLTDKASTYEPAQRSHKWLKVKKDYIDGMTDTLDLVPIGAFYGKVYAQTHQMCRFKEFMHIPCIKTWPAGDAAASTNFSRLCLFSYLPIFKKNTLRTIGQAHWGIRRVSFGMLQ